MNREQAKKWLPEIAHWANGGDLWGCVDNEWYIIEAANMSFTNKIYVIEDKHFEARKAFALGEPIEQQSRSFTWFDNSSPDWSGDKYRPKIKEWHDNIPKEGVLCWVWDSDGNEKFGAKIVTSHRSKWQFRFQTIDNSGWKHAKPVKTEECWKDN